MSLHKIKRMVASLIGVVFVAGCTSASVGRDPEESSTVQPPPTEPVSTAYPSLPDVETPAPGLPDLSSGEVPQELFDAVLVDLLARTDGDRADVELVMAEAITWSDGSLGCPQPGVMYTQALVEGYQVVFSLNGQTYDYHVSDRGSFILCENELSNPGAVGTLEE